MQTQQNQLQEEQQAQQEMQAQQQELQNELQNQQDELQNQQNEVQNQQMQSVDKDAARKDAVRTIRVKNNNEFKLDLISAIFAFILIILFVISGVFLTATGHDTVGGIIFSTTIIGVAGLFITGTYNKTQK